MRSSSNRRRRLSRDTVVADGVLLLERDTRWVNMESKDEDDKSSVSSIVNSVVGGIANASAALMDKGLVKRVQEGLCRDVDAKTVLNGGYSGEHVVMSPHIIHMLSNYAISSTGRVLVVCAPADSGKSRAAYFLIHGNHPYRPKRSLMISAAGMEDFPAEFSALLGAPKAAPNLSELLCTALAKTKEPKDRSASQIVAGAAGDVMDSVFCLFENKQQFVEEIGLYGERQVKPNERLAKTFRRMPVLIIDNFNKATDESRRFTEKLFQEASQRGVFVLMLTTNESWASKLVGLNGGSKIKPLHGNVNNTDYEIVGHFRGVPEWNEMPWPVPTLRDCVRPLCQEHGIDPALVVPDGAKMTPVEAGDKLLRMIGAVEPNGDIV